MIGTFGDTLALRASITGSILLQGGHHEAPKSTNTTGADCNMAAYEASEISSVFLRLISGLSACRHAVIPPFNSTTLAKPSASRAFLALVFTLIGIILLMNG